MATYLSENILYKDGQAKEVINDKVRGTDIKISAKGTGSYQLIGKININDEMKVINLINLNDFSTTDTALDDNIYVADITGLYSVSVQNVTGFENIKCVITYDETYLSKDPISGEVINKLSINSDGQLIYDGKIIGYSDDNVGQKSANAVYAEIFNDYENNVASGNYSHAEGYKTTSSGFTAHSEGYFTVASDSNAHAEGCYATANNSNAHAEGNWTIASGINAHAEGDHTTASGLSSHAEGYYTTSSGGESHAEGGYTKAVGHRSHAECYGTQAIGDYSHAEGYYTIAKGYYSHAGGQETIANNYQIAVGNYNIDTTAPTSGTDTTGSLFIIGNGTGNKSRSNAFRIATDGSVYGCGEYSSSGADYAEMFEWLDGNERNEDRRGLFVTLDGDKIKLANADDYVLGVISANPSVVGDVQSEQWQGKYMKDIFGCNMTKETSVVDENGKETDKVAISYELNPDYNSDYEYISREYRKEWATVGLMGKLVVVDDGTCTVNGYCMPKNGIATKSETGYRVMKRLDDTHISIILK